MEVMGGGHCWRWSWSPLRTLAPAATVLAARGRQLRRLSRAETASSLSWPDNPDMSAMFDYVWTNGELAPFNAFTHKTLPTYLIPYHIISGQQTASNWGTKIRCGSNNWNTEAERRREHLRRSGDPRPHTRPQRHSAVSSSAARVTTKHIIAWWHFIMRLWWLPFIAPIGGDTPHHFNTVHKQGYIIDNN